MVDRIEGGTTVLTEEARTARSIVEKYLEGKYRLPTELKSTIIEYSGNLADFLLRSSPDKTTTLVEELDQVQYEILVGEPQPKGLIDIARRTALLQTVNLIAQKVALDEKRTIQNY